MLGLLLKVYLIKLLVAEKKRLVYINHMISEEEIRRIAKLSYLEIKDEEIGEMREKFSSILEYVKKLQELDVSLVKETANLSQSENIFRPDIGIERDSEDLLKALPRRRDNYLEVKKILYNEDN